MSHLGEDAPLTVEEFLRFEEHAEERHEFIGGRIYAMTGATARHNLIAGNIYVRLRGMAGAGRCRVYIEGVQLRLPGDVYYPDVMVVCAPDGDDEKRANAPCLVVEVRSPSTGAIDLYGHKLHAYQALPSVLTYLVVEQERRAVVHHWRTSPRAAWQREELIDAGRLALPCPAPGGVLTLDEVYEGIALPSGRPPLRRIREDVGTI
jgi:Uma2 family endonuclease